MATPSQPIPRFIDAALDVIGASSHQDLQRQDCQKLALVLDKLKCALRRHDEPADKSQAEPQADEAQEDEPREEEAQEDEAPEDETLEDETKTREWLQAVQRSLPQLQDETFVNCLLSKKLEVVKKRLKAAISYKKWAAYQPTELATMTRFMRAHSQPTTSNNRSQLSWGRTIAKLHKHFPGLLVIFGLGRFRDTERSGASGEVIIRLLQSEFTDIVTETLRFGDLARSIITNIEAEMRPEKRKASAMEQHLLFDDDVNLENMLREDYLHSSFDIPMVRHRYDDVARENDPYLEKTNINATSLPEPPTWTSATPDETNPIVLSSQLMARPFTATFGEPMMPRGSMI